jgi:hypothetical protein
VSVIIIVHFAVEEAAGPLVALRSRPDPVAVTTRGKEMGQIGNLVATGPGEMVSISQWPSVEAYNAFMNDQRDEINALRSAAGLKSEPTSIEVYEVVVAPGSFWQS